MHLMLHCWTASTEGEEKSKRPLVEFLMGSCSLRFCVVHKNEKKNQILKSFSKWERKKISDLEATDMPLDGLYFFEVRGPLGWHKVWGCISKTRILEKRGSFPSLVSSVGQVLVTSGGCGHMNPNPGIEPRSPALQVDSLSSEPPGKSC